MLKPPINELISKVDSRYTLVIATAKRARQIIDGSDKLTDTVLNKPVSVATQEIFEDKISYKRLESDK